MNWKDVFLGFWIVFCGYALGVSLRFLRFVGTNLEDIIRTPVHAYIYAVLTILIFISTFAWTYLFGLSIKVLFEEIRKRDLLKMMDKGQKEIERTNNIRSS